MSGNRVSMEREWRPVSMERECRLENAEEKEHKNERESERQRKTEARTFRKQARGPGPEQHAPSFENVP